MCAAPASLMILLQSYQALLCKPPILFNFNWSSPNRTPPAGCCHTSDALAPVTHLHRLPYTVVLLALRRAYWRRPQWCRWTIQSHNANETEAAAATASSLHAPAPINRQSVHPSECSSPATEACPPRPTAAALRPHCARSHCGGCGGWVGGDAGGGRWRRWWGCTSASEDRHHGSTIQSKPAPSRRTPPQQPSARRTRRRSAAAGAGRSAADPHSLFLDAVLWGSVRLPARPRDGEGAPRAAVVVEVQRRPALNVCDHRQLVGELWWAWCHWFVCTDGEWEWGWGWGAGARPLPEQTRRRWVAAQGQKAFSTKETRTVFCLPRYPLLGWRIPPWHGGCCFYRVLLGAVCSGRARGVWWRRLQSAVEVQKDGGTCRCSTARAGARWGRWHERVGLVLERSWWAREGLVPVEAIWVMRACKSAASINQSNTYGGSTSEI